MRKKGGGEWYHSIANGLGLRCWAVFFLWIQLLLFNLHISISTLQCTEYS